MCLLISVTDLLLFGSQMMTAMALKIRLNLEGLLVSHTHHFTCVLVSSVCWDRGAFSMEEQGIFSHFLDSLLVSHRGVMLK